MNVEMQTHHTCCCNHTAQQIPAANKSQSGESFSAVFSSVSISSYFNPWTGKSVTAEQASAAQTNSLQSVLQNMPKVKLDPNSWFSPDTQLNSLSYVRTTAIRIVSSQSQDSSEFLQTILNSLKKNQEIEDEERSCGCPHEAETSVIEASNSPDNSSETKSVT